MSFLHILSTSSIQDESILVISVNTLPPGQTRSRCTRQQYTRGCAIPACSVNIQHQTKVISESTLIRSMPLLGPPLSSTIMCPIYWHKGRFSFFNKSSVSVTKSPTQKPDKIVYFISLFFLSEKNLISCAKKSHKRT